MGDFVTTDDGSGLVHQAPAFGAEDMQMAVEHDLPILMTVKPDGTFVDEVTPWRGIWVKNADPLIITDLENRGLLFRMEPYTHNYPFCWRCDTPLLYYARGTWFIRTSKYKERLVALNQEINWVPEHVKQGRFGNWLDNNVDWALGRERYWGTPLPVWECVDCRHQEAVGSVAELSQKAGKDLTGIDLAPSVCGQGGMEMPGLWRQDEARTRVDRCLGLIRVRCLMPNGIIHLEDRGVPQDEADLVRKRPAARSATRLALDAASARAVSRRRRRAAPGGRLDCLARSRTVHVQIHTTSTDASRSSRVARGRRAEAAPRRSGRARSTSMRHVTRPADEPGADEAAGARTSGRADEPHPTIPIRITSSSPPRSGPSDGPASASAALRVDCPPADVCR